MPSLGSSFPCSTPHLIAILLDILPVNSPSEQQLLSEVKPLEPQSDRVQHYLLAHAEASMIE
jgi:hypothetical protein